MAPSRTLVSRGRPEDGYPRRKRGPRLAALPLLPRRDAGGPVFAEPWQAQAFALAVRLSEQGHFTWKEWAAALAAELKAAAACPPPARGEPDDGSHYYHHWLAALERLVVEKGLADPLALLARKNAWAEAYRATPHGQPVELKTTRSGGPGR
jgi:nitrile hydratase accessory protein